MAKISENNTFSKLIDEVSNQANQAHGPDIYVIRSLIPLIRSSQKVFEASTEIKKAIQRFETTSEKSEKLMKGVTWIGIAVAFAQLVLAWMIWRS